MALGLNIRPSPSVRLFDTKKPATNAFNAVRDPPCAARKPPSSSTDSLRLVWGLALLHLLVHGDGQAPPCAMEFLLFSQPCLFFLSGPSSVLSRREPFLPRSILLFPSRMPYHARVHGQAFWSTRPRCRHGPVQRTAGECYHRVSRCLHGRDLRVMPPQTFDLRGTVAPHPRVVYISHLCFLGGREREWIPRWQCQRRGLQRETRLGRGWRRSVGIAGRSAGHAARSFSLCNHPSVSTVRLAQPLDLGFAGLGGPRQAFLLSKIPRSSRCYINVQLS